MILAVAVLVAAAAHGDGCAEAREIIAAHVDDGNQLDKLIEALPIGAVPIKVQARFVLGDDGVAKGLEVMSGAVNDGCRALDADAPATAKRAAAIMEGDARFAGVRKGDDLLDRLMHKAKLWVASLFESSGMKAYAASARIVYLSALVIAAAFVAVRLVRALSRSKRASEEEKSAVAAVERRRQKAFASWRDEAQKALGRGDARGSLRAGQAALLARVGELERGAVTPARTHREIVARLPASTSAAVSPALGAFDAAWFGKDATLDDATAFLAAVDAAAARLATEAATPAGAR